MRTKWNLWIQKLFLLFVWKTSISKTCKIIWRHLQIRLIVSIRKKTHLFQTRPRECTIILIRGFNLDNSCFYIPFLRFKPSFLNPPWLWRILSSGKTLVEHVLRFCWKQRLNFDSSHCSDQYCQCHKNNPKSQEDWNDFCLLDFLYRYNMP